MKNKVTVSGEEAQAVGDSRGHGIMQEVGNRMEHSPEETRELLQHLLPSVGFHGYCFL